MTVKLSTTLNNIERSVLNEENKELIKRFFDFMKKIETSERYQILVVLRELSLHK